MQQKNAVMEMFPNCYCNLFFSLFSRASLLFLNLIKRLGDIHHCFCSFVYLFVCFFGLL